MPGETLEKGIQDVFILQENEGLILKANETFVDELEVSEVLGLLYYIFIFYVDRKR